MKYPNIVEYLRPECISESEKLLLAKWLTKYMHGAGASWEANTEEISRIFWNPKVHYRV
jgi:hypothetical protein